MPQIAPQEFLGRPLRVHTFLSDVAMHDVWAVDLPFVRGRTTLQEFQQRIKGRDLAKRISWLARGL
jgi:hypothetical protein